MVSRLLWVKGFIWRERKHPDLLRFVRPVAYCSTCRSPQGSRCRWWPPPHLQTHMTWGHRSCWVARRGGVTVISGWHYQTEGTMYSDVWVERGWVESVTLGMHGEQTRTKTKTGRPYQIRYITPLGPVSHTSSPQKKPNQ